MLVTAATAACGLIPADVPSQPPALVVMVVVDQLRADLPEVYGPALNRGFARLKRDGFRFTNATHRHATTTTAVGHATLSTGVVPARHGIVGNSFRSWTPDGRFPDIYSVEDTLSPIVGYPDAEGRSPRNLDRGGLADWMVAADSGTRVVAISKKDRGAIPLAGTVPGHVYWIQAAGGQFVTSTYYRDTYPDWVDAFNRDRMPELMGDSVWVRLTPDSLTGLARRDTADYEGDGVNVAFPHQRALEAPGEAPSRQWVWASETPAPDQAVLELAKVAMRELGLGRRKEGPDFLALSLSQTDYVGHAYGPMSQEQLSNLIHLDGVLEDLFTLLDQEVGPGRWVLGLSADHGVMSAPEWLEETGVPAHRLSAAERREMTRIAAEAAEGAPSAEEAQRRVARAVEQMPWVERVYLPTEVAGQPADTMAALFGRSRSDTRFVGPLARYGLYVQFAPSVLDRPEPRGTTHGTPYWYDRHVPMILMGAGVAAGTSPDAAFTYDMAPTLAALSGIPVPGDLDGRPLLGGRGRNP